MIMETYRKGKNTQPLLDMFANSTPKDEFTVWCESQVAGFKNPHIDGNNKTLILVFVKYLLPNSK